MLRSVLLLVFISSCSFLKGTPSLKTIDTDRLLNSIKLTGEGKGRLTLGQSQHVFSVDSVLNEDLDWIFAVSIPLHGEEVMILSDIKSHQMKFSEVSSFEERIAKEFQRLKLNKILTTEKFMKELRLLIRFGLSPQWGQKRDCKPQQNETVCELDGEKFIVHVLDTEIKIKKLLGQGKSLQIVAKNLTDSFFQKTDIILFLNDDQEVKKVSPFSLEIFW
jgi:hypothetical protein